MSAKALGLERGKMIGNEVKKASSSQIMQGLTGHSEDSGFHSGDHGYRGRVLNGRMPHICPVKQETEHCRSQVPRRPETMESGCVF